ncbi:hypothetical protein [Vibrio parahaemolyticus]|uniref:hypothetical protein n=1 Tax=Vibrio parahaemolyticus TaxID=670 RepID=UPI001A35B873|nr:hypothetical protein [Vibrio parahaemolyticus]MCG6428434.1 hypothetical protein [Vibrio parahaemolyticus]HAS6087807.1 hypothetical protein [Vibrio vulnificus]
MSLTKGAVMLGQRPRFREFLAALLSRHVDSEHQAAVAVRDYCGIASRRELNTNRAAGDKYRHLIRLFNRWMNGEPIHQERSQ